MKCTVKTLLVLLLFFGASMGQGEVGVVEKSYYSSYELEKQQRYGEAIKALAPVVKEYPQGYTVNYRSGWLSYLGGNYSSARKYYQVALTQYPSSVEVRKALILLEVARKEWKSVEREARIGRSIDYYNLDYNYWQMVALRKIGNSAAANKLAEQMSALYPTNVKVLMELVYNAQIAKNHASVMAYLSSVLILDPYNPEATDLLRLYIQNANSDTNQESKSTEKSK